MEPFIVHGQSLINSPICTVSLLTILYEDKKKTLHIAALIFNLFLFLFHVQLCIVIHESPGTDMRKFLICKQCPMFFRVHPAMNYLYGIFIVCCHIDTTTLINMLHFIQMVIILILIISQFKILLIINLIYTIINAHICLL